MGRNRNKTKVTVALMDEYMDIPLEQLDYLSHVEEARNLFGFLSMCMVHNAEKCSKTWQPMIETMQAKRRLEREQRKTG